MNEIHITSFLVCTRPAEAQAMAQRLAALAGHEVHAVQDGKIVLTLESASEGEIVQALDHLQRLDGVLAANLVYHHAEAAEELGGDVR